MRKLGLMILGLSAAIQAQAQNVQFAAGIFEQGNGAVRRVENTQNIVGKQQRFCWVAHNLPMKSHYLVTEIMHSPKKLKVSAPDMRTTAIDGGKTNIINATRALNYNGNFIEHCWEFEESDPEGKYTLEIKVGDFTLPTQQFEVKHK